MLYINLSINYRKHLYICSTLVDVEGMNKDSYHGATKCLI